MSDLPPSGEVPAIFEPVFLGVEASLSGRRWRPRLKDDRLGLALAQRLDLPEIVGRIMAGRDVGIDEADVFLDPTLRDLLPDPSIFKDMDRAAERLARAIVGGEAVAVFGDYDVDGATSSALLKRYFETVGAPLIIHIPDRMKEGYGPNAPALLSLKARGASLIVTVDCGTVAYEPLEAAHEAGLDVIVVDHHLAEPKLPRAVAVVNPNRIDEGGECRQLAAVGVVFLLIVALNRCLRNAGWFGEGRSEPNLMQWLDLVALGTVCDVVPLTGLNRAFVTQGLKVMARRRNVGMAALADVAGMSEKPGTYHAGFLLGPRVNAGGRVGRSDLGARLLTTHDAAEAAELAAELDRYNTERKAIEAEVQEQAMAMAERGGVAERSVVMVAAEGWHPGVIGIVASRLKERFGRPAFVIALEGGVGKGSGRSVRGVDLGAAVTAARQEGLLVNGGGHSMAAGLTVEAGKLDELAAFFDHRLAEAVREAAASASLGIDGAIAVTGATIELIDQLQHVGPYGAGNAEPRFVLPNVRILRADVVGENHVRCIVGGQDGGRLNAIAFRSLETPLGEALLSHQGATFHLAGHLRADSWRGERRVQFFIEDGALPSRTGC